MPATISHAKSDTVADWAGVVTVGNSTGGTATAQASDLVRPSDWNSGHAVSFSASASELTGIFSFNNGLSSSTAAGGISVGIASIGFFEPFIPANTNSTLSSPGAGTWYLDPINLPFALGSGQLNHLMADVAGFIGGTTYSATSAGSWSRRYTLNNQFALYQLGTGANTTRLESVWSKDLSLLASWSGTGGGVSSSRMTFTNALTLSFPGQWDASGGMTYSSSSQSGTKGVSATTAASNSLDSLVSGLAAYVSGSKMMPMPFATSVSAGLYWLAHMWSTSSAVSNSTYAAGTGFPAQSRVHMLEFVGQAYKRLGLSVSNASTVFEQFHGSLATTSSSPYSTIGTSDVRNLVTNHRMYWNYGQSSY